MALLPIEQASELIKKSKSILIVFKKDWSGDSLASAMALGLALKKKGIKKLDVVCQDFKPKNNFNFLPTGPIKGRLENLQKFIISIDTTKTKVGEFFYDHDENKLNVYLTPESGGKFSDNDVATASSDYTYDLVIVINSPDLESLGHVFEKNSDFFYATTKINIDNSSRNEYFGNVDLINLAKASASEVVLDLIKNMDKDAIDEDMATLLLFGIISATKNFKTTNVTPQTLETASQLIELGARREQIVQNLYQSRFLSTLKLWGRVLSRLNNDLDDKLVWSIISNEDFVETSTTPDEIMDVIDELIVSMPKTEIIVLIYEKKKDIEAIVYSVNNIDSTAIAKKFDPTGNKELARISLPNKNLSEAEKIIIEEIKSKLQ